MKSYIKEELKRAFLSKMTIITALFSILLMIIGMFDSGELPFLGFLTYLLCTYFL